MVTIRTFSTEVHVAEHNIPCLLEAAVEAGFSREHPNRQWLKAEEKRAISFLVRHLVRNLQDP